MYTIRLPFVNYLDYKTFETRSHETKSTKARNKINVNESYLIPYVSTLYKLFFFFEVFTVLFFLAIYKSTSFFNLIYLNYVHKTHINVKWHNRYERIKYISNLFHFLKALVKGKILRR